MYYLLARPPSLAHRPALVGCTQQSVHSSTFSLVLLKVAVPPGASREYQVYFSFVYFYNTPPYSYSFFEYVYSVRSIFHKKLKNVSCEYDRCMVESPPCELRDTSDTLVGRACATFQLKYVWCLWITSTIWLLIPSSTSFMVGRSRVFYIYFSWDI